MPVILINLTFPCDCLHVRVLQADKHFPFRKLLRRFLELSYPGKFGRWRTAHKKRERYAFVWARYVRA